MPPYGWGITSAMGISAAANTVARICLRAIILIFGVGCSGCSTTPSCGVGEMDATVTILTASISFDEANIKVEVVDRANEFQTPVVRENGGNGIATFTENNVFHLGCWQLDVSVIPARLGHVQPHASSHVSTRDHPPLQL